MVLAQPPSSWKQKVGGAEPDISFCIGTNKDFPDIVVEVVQTSGGMSQLSIYQGLNVPEVWFWQTGQFVIYHLQGENYQQVNRSLFLPELDLSLLATYVQHPEPLDAVLEFRAAIRQSLQ
jgi:Uma2 family endonuclease